MPTIPVRRLPPLRGREHEAVGHLHGDSPHIHAPSGYHNARLTYKSTGNSTTVDLTGAVNLTLEGHEP